jgi:hypothetical protein
MLQRATCASVHDARPRALAELGRRVRLGVWAGEWAYSYARGRASSLWTWTQTWRATLSSGIHICSSHHLSCSSSSRDLRGPARWKRGRRGWVGTTAGSGLEEASRQVTGVGGGEAEKATSAGLVAAVRRPGDRHGPSTRPDRGVRHHGLVRAAHADLGVEGGGQKEEAGGAASLGRLPALKTQRL